MSSLLTSNLYALNMKRATGMVRERIRALSRTPIGAIGWTALPWRLTGYASESATIALASAPPYSSSR
jgi:hypothetical protein